MNKKNIFVTLAVLAIFGAALLFGYKKWGSHDSSAREEILTSLPADASMVFFGDFSELRRAPFFSQLYSWAPKPQNDPEYAEFIKQTGFDYERDLDRVAIAVDNRGPQPVVFAVADGRFDRKKIAAYALKSGLCSTYKGHEVCSVPVSDHSRRISFTFLRDDRIALTNDARLSERLVDPQKSQDAREWQTRFERLAGSPVFAVIRQDATPGAALSAQAPGGFRSPQLSNLLDQLQWITIAAKPDNDVLRVVADGESTIDSVPRQLVDLLNGVVLFAQAGLNDPKTRQQLDPAAREAYLELLKSADVSRIDRGDTKSVRLILEVTPKFLEAARSASSIAPGPVPSKPQPQKTPALKKGHI